MAEITLGTTVQTLDNKIYKLEDIGIITRDFNPSSPSPKHNFEDVDGSHRTVDLGTTYKQRPINCSFYLKAVDMWDYALLRDEVFKIFDSRKPFYIIDQRNPGKRWLVKCASDYSIDQQRIYGFFDIQFITVELPFAESIGTTLDPMTFDSNLWQIGQGLIAEDLFYKFPNTSFSVYNAGVTIDPKSMHLAIRVYGVTTNLSITNRTTGDVWQYTGETVASDVIELNGVRSLKNGVSIFGKTNYKLITIAPGWNDFVVTGVTGPFNIEFEFRYYYL